MRKFLRNATLSTSMLVATCLLFGGALRAEDEPESASDNQPSSIKIAGVFEAIGSHEVKADTEQIESLELARIVDHGTRVKQGQNVAWFETEDIDEKIREAEIDLRLAKLTLEDDEFKHLQFLEDQKLDRAAAERKRKQAQQDFDNFVRVDREREKKSAEFSLKSSRASLDNALEELQQLRQMYEEDDLTEESEEIVLKRAKQAVEFAEYRLEGTEIQSQRTISQSIPRSQAQHEDALARAQLAYESAIQNLASARRRQEIEMDRKRKKFDKQQEKLDELKAERKRLVLTSPADGILLHGKLRRAKLGDKPSVLEKGSKVTPQQVLVTVVEPDRLQIRVDLDENHLADVTRGSRCDVAAKAFPDNKMVGTVKSVSTVPYAGTKYDCVVSFRGKNSDAAILPTMTCELEFADGSPEEAAPAPKPDPKPNAKASEGKNQKDNKKAESDSKKKDK